MQRIAAMLGAFVALAFIPLGVVAAPQVDTPDFAEVDAFVGSTMRESGLPGVALGVVHGSEIVHMRGYGVADSTGRPVTPQTPFLIGSNTKGFTALAIMQLVEQGRIDLNAPVQGYLPWFRLADAEASDRITVQQLLNHTSGIPSSALYSSWAAPELTLQEYGRQLASVHTNRPVGSSFQYANANYNLAGLIVEAVSGQPYAEYVEQHIFAPLEMTRSAATPQRQQQLGLADGYNWWFGLGPFPAHERFSQANLPAGFLASTAEDMSHYLLAQVNGGRYGATRILSPEGIARMHTAGPNTEAIGAAGGRGRGAGLGWATAEINGRPFVTHTGETFGFKSVQLLDHQNGWGVVLLTNASNQLPSGDEPYRTLYSGILSRLEGLELPSTGPGLRAQYAIVDAVLLAVSAALLWGLFRVPAWRRGLERRLQQTRRPVRTALTVVRVGLEILVPLGVVVLAPKVLEDSGWPVVLLATPDLGRWVLVAASVLLLTGLVHAVLLAVALKRQRPGAPVRAAQALRPSLT
jgi:CubicO group peptidase (beta-lactamase class C family)